MAKLIKSGLLLVPCRAQSPGAVGIAAKEVSPGTGEYAQWLPWVSGDSDRARARVLHQTAGGFIRLSHSETQGHWPKGSPRGGQFMPVTGHGAHADEGKAKALAAVLAKRVERIGASVRKKKDRIHERLEKSNAEGVQLFDKYFAIKGDRTSKQLTPDELKYLKAATAKAAEADRIRQELDDLNGEVRRQVLAEVSPGGRADFETPNAFRTPNVDAGTAGFRQMVGSGNGLDGRVVTINPEEPGARYAGRSYSRDNGVYMSDHASERITVHELGHVWEAMDSDIHARALAFYDRRTKESGLISMNDAQPGRGYGDDENTRPDKFLDPYVGKDYTDAGRRRYATEVVSMGLEHMYHDPVAFLEKDPDHFAFIFELMNRNRQPRGRGRKKRT